MAAWGTLLLHSESVQARGTTFFKEASASEAHLTHVRSQPAVQAAVTKSGPQQSKAAAAQHLTAARRAMLAQ